MSQSMPMQSRQLPLITLDEPYQPFVVEAASLLLRLADGSHRIIPVTALIDEQSQLAFLDRQVLLCQGFVSARSDIKMPEPPHNARAEKNSEPMGPVVAPEAVGEMLTLLADPGSWVSLEAPVVSSASR